MNNAQNVIHFPHLLLNFFPNVVSLLNGETPVHVHVDLHLRRKSFECCQQHGPQMGVEDYEMLYRARRVIIGFSRPILGCDA